MLTDAYCKLRGNSPVGQTTTANIHHSLLIDTPAQYTNLPSPILSNSSPTRSQTTNSIAAIHQQTTSSSSSTLLSSSPSSFLKYSTINHSYNNSRGSSGNNCHSSSVHNHHQHHHQNTGRRNTVEGNNGSPAKKTKLSDFAGSTLGGHHHYNSPAATGHTGSQVNLVEPTHSLVGSISSFVAATARPSIHDKLRELYIELLAEDNTNANKVMFFNITKNLYIEKYPFFS